MHYRRVSPIAPPRWPTAQTGPHRKDEPTQNAQTVIGNTEVRAAQDRPPGTEAEEAGDPPTMMRAGARSHGLGCTMLSRPNTRALTAFIRGYCAGASLLANIRSVLQVPCRGVFARTAHAATCGETVSQDPNLRT